MNKNEPDSVARNIKKYRLLNKMTQEELAQHLNLDPQYYGISITLNWSGASGTSPCSGWSASAACSISV